MAHERVIAHRGYEETDLDASPGGVHQRLDHLFVEKDVWVGDLDRPAGRGQGQEERGVHRVASARGAATNDLRVDSAFRLDRAGKVIRSAEYDPRGLDPVLGERALEVLDDGPFDADVGVTPVAGHPTVPHPLVADAGATREAYAAIDDEDATVVPVVRPVETEGADRPERDHLAAVLGHELRVFPRHAKGPHAVE